MSEDDEQTRLHRVEFEQRKQGDSLKAAWVILIFLALTIFAYMWWPR